MSPRGLRLVLINAAAASSALAVALLWQHATRPQDAGFAPPEADVCIVPAARASAAHPYDPASGLGIHDARPIPAQARCAVCGMYPARFPRWAAQLVLDDGGALFFDSPVDLFMFLAEPARFDGTGRNTRVAAVFVSDHSGRGWVDARRAVYVAGSTARGPMRGPDLPAFADASAATAFAAEHGGRAVRLDGIDSALLASLRDENHARHFH